jgi:spore coat protein U-like protein
MLNKALPVALALAVAGLLLFSPTAFASSTSTNLNVSANVLAWCTINADPVNFGDYAGNGATVPLNVYVLCSETVPYAVAMDAGQNYTSTWRHMTDGSSLLRYALSKPGGGEWNDAGYGDTYCCGTPVGGTGSGGTQTLAGSAFVFGGYAVTPGAYADVVVVSVNW